MELKKLVMGFKLISMVGLSNIDRQGKMDKQKTYEHICVSTVLVLYYLGYTNSFKNKEDYFTSVGTVRITGFIPQTHILCGHCGNGCTDVPPG